MGETHWDARKLNMLLAQKATDFIKRNAGGDKPFYLTTGALRYIFRIHHQKKLMV